MIHSIVHSDPSIEERLDEFLDECGVVYGVFCTDINGVVYGVGYGVVYGVGYGVVYGVTCVDEILVNSLYIELFIYGLDETGILSLYIEYNEILDGVSFFSLI